MVDHEQPTISGMPEIPEVKRPVRTEAEGEFGVEQARKILEMIERGSEADHRAEAPEPAEQVAAPKPDRLFHIRPAPKQSKPREARKPDRRGLGWRGRLTADNDKSVEDYYRDIS